MTLHYQVHQSKGTKVKTKSHQNKTNEHSY